MCPYKIKYRIITVNHVELLDDYDQAFELAGKYLSEQGCVAMDLLLIGPRSLSDDGDVVLYKQSMFSAMK